MTDQPNPTSSAQNQSPDESPSRAVELARVELLLAHGTIDNVYGSTVYGSNYALLVSVHDDELQTAAIYKPQRGERPLWDFPNGTLCYREALAYTVSEVLGWHLVPPTVLRTGPHGLGSLQFFIEHNPEINYFSLDDRFIDQLQRFALFDAVINNADRKGGHVLMDRHGKLWGIDHGLTFHPQPKLRTVIWEFAGSPIDDSLLSDIAHLRDQLVQSDCALCVQIREQLGSEALDMLLRRIERLLERKTYPQPGPGPNHPWPPI